MDGTGSVEARILKDIHMFGDSIRGFDLSGKGKKAEYVGKMSKAYASDAQSYLDKGDLFTAFSCISYAHGLLDALKELYSD